MNIISKYRDTNRLGVVKSLSLSESRPPLSIILECWNLYDIIKYRKELKTISSIIGLYGPSYIISSFVKYIECREELSYIAVHKMNPSQIEGFVAYLTTDRTCLWKGGESFVESNG